MEEANKQTQEERPDAQAQQPESAQTPFLSASFFSKLVKQPTCLTKGICNNCGRCEH